MTSSNSTSNRSLNNKQIESWLENILASYGGDQATALSAFFKDLSQLIIDLETAMGVKSRDTTNELRHAVISQLAVKIRAMDQSRTIFTRCFDYLGTLPSDSKFKWEVATILLELTTPAERELPPQLINCSLETVESDIGELTGKFSALALVDDTTFPTKLINKTSNKVVKNFLKPWFSMKSAKDRRTAYNSLISSGLIDTEQCLQVTRAAQLAGVDVYPNLKNICAKLLRDKDPNLRSQALTLITGGTKTTARISPEIFSVLIETHNIWLAEATSRSRFEVLAVIRQMLARVRASTWKKSDFEAEKSFVEWLRDKMLGSWILTNAPYRCLATSTRVLEVLVASGVDSSVDGKFVERGLSSPWAFHVTIYTPSLVSLLVDLASNDYSDVRASASKLLEMAPTALKKESASIVSLRARALALLSGARGRQGDGGARVAAVAYDLMDTESAANYLQELLTGASSTNSEVHGYFAALALICEKHSAPAGADFHLIMETVYKTWQECEATLTNGAPEGNVPFQDGMDELDSHVDSQSVLSHAWRAVKESVNLVEVIVPQLETGDLITLGQVLVQQLTSIRHRGAFSAVHPTFYAVCSRLAKAKDPELQALPKKWLMDELVDVQERERLVTRRSAGLPMLVTGVLAAQPQLVQEISTYLLLQAEKTVNTDKLVNEGLMLPQVHAYNCIRSVITDARISKESECCVESALQAAVRACGSSIWVLRNCGVMLFASIHARLFRKGTISAQTFFVRFKNLKTALLAHLSQVDTRVETVFPALALLQKLDVQDSYDGLKPFEPVIFALLYHREWKIREQAARTLACITSPGDKQQLVGKLTDSSLFNLSNQNRLHGHALTLAALHVTVDFDVDALICHNDCFETRIALGRVWSGSHLPSVDCPERLNPGWADYEALRMSKDKSIALSRKFKDEWAAIWRVAIERATAEDIRYILQTTKLPDIQCLCVRLLDQEEVPKYTGKRYAQSVRETAIGMLSDTWKVSNPEKFQSLIKEFADEAAPLTSRNVALSALQFTSLPESSRLRSFVFYHLLLFLSDDEEVIREKAALVVARILNVPRYAPRALEGSLASKISSEFAREAIYELFDPDAVEKITKSEELLFAVEKENLYRDDNLFVKILTSSLIPASGNDAKRRKLILEARQKLLVAKENDRLVGNWYLWTQLAITEALLEIF